MLPGQEDDVDWYIVSLIIALFIAVACLIALTRARLERPFLIVLFVVSVGMALCLAINMVIAEKISASLCPF